MTIPISSIVEVNITRQTQAVAATAFGVPLVFGEHSNTSERIVFVSSLSGVSDLGFSSSDTIYKVAAAIFAQNPRPSSVAIGRKDANVQGVITVDFSVDLIADNVVTFLLNGITIGPVTFSSDHATTMGLIKAAVDAETDYVASSVVSGNDLAITFLTGVDPSITDATVTGGASQPTVTITETTPAVTYASELDLLVVESEGFYEIQLDTTNVQNILSVAAWTESHNPRKIFSYRTSDSDSKTSATTDIGSIVQGKGYTRTVSNYHNVADEFLDAAIFGLMLPEDPGSATFKFKSPAGITADSLNQAEVAILVGKNINHFVSVGDVNVYKEGVCASGAFIDEIMGVDWIESTIQTNVYSRLVNAKKIPYTDKGIAVIENEVGAVLREAIDRGILAADPAPSTSAIAAADVSTNDKAIRYYSGVSFTGVLAGAIHKTAIAGTITL